MTSSHPRRLNVSHTRQAGMVTLITSVTILLLATIMVIAVSRTTLMEQRMSGNEVRQRQAFEAAEAGLNFALAYMGVKNPTGADKNMDGSADPFLLTTLLASQYSVAFCDNELGFSCPESPGSVICTAPVNDKLSNPRIVACGWSDDGLGRQMISQGTAMLPAISQGPTNPVTAKGAVNVSGSATVTNYFNNLTVWSGGSLTDIGNSGKTFVRNPTVSPPLAGTVSPNLPNSCTTSVSYVCSTDKNTTGPDVIQDDPTLSNLTDDQLFLNFFGVPNAEIYSASVASRGAVLPSELNSLTGVVQESFVISGSVTQSHNMPSPIGSRLQPVVMIIDGNWEAAGTTTIYGIVYIRGDVNLKGNITVNGGIVVEGTVSGTGSLDVIFDPLITGNAANNMNRYSPVPGSWRDW